MLTLAPHYAGSIAIPSAEVTRLMVAALNIQRGEKVLEIGTGSGFQTWRLSETGAQVYSIELNPQFSPVDELKGPHLFCGDGFNGMPDSAPFDVIISTCGVEDIPPAWIEQLRDNGRMLVPLGNADVQRLVLLVKRGFAMQAIKTLGYVRFVMMERNPEAKPLKPVYRERPHASGE